MMFQHPAPAHVGRMEKTPKNTKKNKKFATSSVLGKVPFPKNRIYFKMYSNYDTNYQFTKFTKQNVPRLSRSCLQDGSSNCLRVKL